VIAPNHISRLGNILIPINPLPLGGSIKFFKLECSGELKEGDRIIRVEFSRSAACVLSWRLYCTREGILNWAYLGSNEINFSNKMLVIEIEDEHITSFIV